jgi:hypothetical protein
MPIRVSTSTNTSKRKPTRHRPRSSRRNGIIPVALVMIVVLVLVIVQIASGSGPSSADGTNSSGTTPLSEAATKAVTRVPASVLDSVADPSGLAPPQRIQGAHAVLTANGKPDIFYLGAEYCPFCAAERWPLVVALSRFGTFTGLRATHSAAGDEYPNTATISFYGSRYTSPYITFTPVELNTNEVVGNFYGTLQKPTPPEIDLTDTFDVPPYTSSSGTIPFIDFGNRYVQNGASYNPQILQGLSQGEIAAELARPTDAIAQGVDSTANLMTATICRLTNDQPRSVCTDKSVETASKAMPS